MLVPVLAHAEHHPLELLLVDAGRWQRVAEELGALGAELPELRLSLRRRRALVLRELRGALGPPPSASSALRPCPRIPQIVLSARARQLIGPH